VAELFRRFEVHHNLKQRIPDRETMIEEVGAWEDGRNGEGSTTNWRFRDQDALMKLKFLYPSNQ